MTLRTIISQEDNWLECPASPSENGMAWVTLSGAGMISLGVQTENNQDHLSIAQMFITGDGSSAYIQVHNTSTSSIHWRWYAVSTHDDGADPLDQFRLPGAMLPGARVTAQFDSSRTSKSKS